jgi:hypothetical protein
VTLTEVKKLSEDNYNYNPDLDEVIRQVKEEFKSIFAKRRDLIIKLGEALERTVSNSESICEEIKNALREEIAQGLVPNGTQRYILMKEQVKNKPIRLLQYTQVKQEVFLLLLPS